MESNNLEKNNTEKDKTERKETQRNNFLSEQVKILHAELTSLKLSQQAFLITSIGASGAVLAFLSRYPVLTKIFEMGLSIQLSEMKACMINSFIIAVPLVIILPMWIIFLDKSKSVSRVAGYIAVLTYSMLTDLPITTYG